MCVPARNVCVCYGLWNPPTASVFRHPGLPVGGKHSIFHFIHRHVRSFLLVSLIWHPARASSLRRRGWWKKPSPIFWIWTAIPSSILHTAPLNKPNSLTLFVLFTRRHVISVSNFTLHLHALYAHSGVLPWCTHARTHAHTQVSPLPLVFVNIKPQNDYLNMTSACLCVNAWRICYSYRSAREACSDINVCRLTKWGHKYMNNISRTALRINSWAFDRFIE